MLLRVFPAVVEDISSTLTQLYWASMTNVYENEPMVMKARSREVMVLQGEPFPLLEHVDHYAWLLSISFIRKITRVAQVKY